MGVFTMCRFCGSDWCDGECVTEKHAKEVKEVKDLMAALMNERDLLEAKVEYYKRELRRHNIVVVDEPVLQ